MGYASEKEKIEKRIRLLKRVGLGVLIAVLLFLSVFSLFVPPQTWKYHVAKPKISQRKQGELRIHFLDVGQGDCTLVELPDGKTALIDGGDGSESTATTILRYLNALDVDAIDYLVVTHADSDHCGGLDKVVKYKKIKNAYLPKTLPSVNDEYAELYAALVEEDCALSYSSRKIDISTAHSYSYTLSFLYPYTADVEGEETATESNDSSAVVWLDYQGVSALFTGDVSSEVEKKLMQDHALGAFENRGVDLPSTEIIKIAHHGSNDSTSEEFLRFLGVETAAISCGKNNLYGHPSDDVLTRLQTVNAKVYRTDKNGNITITIKQDGTYGVKTLKN